MELWSPIPEFPNYEVSSYGEVRNVVTGHILVLRMNQFGVVYVPLWRDGEQYSRSIARLVATAFVPVPFEAYDTPINVDGDRTHNHVDNLLWRPRWFAVKYNRQFREPLSSIHIPFPFRDIATGEVTDNSLECARAYGLLERDVVFCYLNRMPVWPTYQEFEIIN